ncbi:MAG: BNR repeat-containing protein [Chitinophagaceae bacterium]|nr:BNR repeat-containing protein [Chitinophagaceae bacterium]
MLRKLAFFFAICLMSGHTVCSQKIKERTISVGKAWSSNTVNTVVFRKNSLCSDGKLQYIAFYDKEGFVILGKRKINSRKWDFRITNLFGNIYDSHNSISIMTDGEGYLHIAWNHHGNQLHYTRSKNPASLDLLPEMQMSGLLENSVTYPEFFSLPGGDLLFLYRDGRSGKGNLVINRYDLANKKWNLLHSNLISGEGQRNAYWQTIVDHKGSIHLSWVWRESPDVATNHDLCYARSDDGGKTWKKSTGETYELPVTQASAEYICRIPMNSGLINQTSMCVTADNMPMIATYWKGPEDAVIQYKVVYKDGDKWKVNNTGFRTTSLSMEGAGTRHSAISRPQIISWNRSGKTAAALIFRDESFGTKVSVACITDIRGNKWTLWHSAMGAVGAWEPSFDTELWRMRKRLDLFLLNSAAGSDNDKQIKPAEDMLRVLSLRFR